MALALAFLLAVSWMVGVHHGSTWGVLCFVLSALAMRMWSRSSRGRRRIGEIQRLAGFPAKKVELYTRLEAKDLLAPDHEPLAWGACQMDWAQALKHCAAGDQDDEEVLFHLRNAEQVFDRSDYPVQWAAVQNNLGIAVLGHHPETDLADAMEQAIDFHRKALGLGGNDEAPEEKAGAYANLAATLMVRIQGSPSDNLSEAIRILEHQALPLLDPVRDRLDWSMTSALLADAYAIREDKGDLENAIRIQEGAVSALEGASRAAAQEWARGHSTPFPLASRMSTIQSYNLACKYLRRHGPGDAAKVIEECERALKELNPVEDAAVCGRVWWTQAKACEYLPDANLPENLACAERCYEQALAIWPNRENAVQLPAMQRGLGDVLFSQRRWRDARSHYAQAIGMERPLLELSSSRAGREHGLREAGDMYARAAYCLCREGAPEEALVLLDQGKAQMLRQALITAEVNLRGLPVAQQQALSAASRRVRDCESSYQKARDVPSETDTGILEDLRRAQRALSELVEDVRKRFPDSLPRSLEFPEIRSLVDADSALVIPVFSSQGSVVILLVAGEPHPIVLWLDDLTDANLKSWREMLHEARKPDAGKTPKEWREGLQKTVVDVSQELWQHFVGPVRQQLPPCGIARWVLVPQAGLQLLPMHAAWRLEDGNPRYLIDEIAVSYAPSLYALATARRRAGQSSCRQALVVGVAQHEGLPYIGGALKEAKGVAKLLGVTAVLDHHAQADRIGKAMEGKAYVHLSCHGMYAERDPLDSALMLGGDTSLTLKSLLSNTNLEACRLAVLSACETGVTEGASLPDEHIGLPVGFLQAGAAGVVGSLWSASDMSTLMLMGRFYHIQSRLGLPPVQALAVAQRWLRRQERWSDPFFWAAFALTGA